MSVMLAQAIVLLALSYVATGFLVATILVFFRAGRIDRIGRPVAVRGEVDRDDDLLVPRTDPASIERLP